MNFKEGEVLYFDKPLRWTSFAVVNKIRYHISRKLGVKKIKVGHAGTLDPLATGVMIICTGKATKRIEEFQYHTKEYIATLQLGATTPSFDLEKEIDATYPTEHITPEMVEDVLKKFVGTIEQIPPAFSACKVDGKRAYDLARTLRHSPRIRPCASPAAYAARRLQSSADFIRRLPFPKAKLPFAKTERSFSKAGFRSQSGAAFCQSSTARPSKQRAPRPATLYKPYGIRRAYSIRSGNSYSSSSYGSLP